MNCFLNVVGVFKTKKWDGVWLLRHPIPLCKSWSGGNRMWRSLWIMIYSDSIYSCHAKEKAIHGQFKMPITLLQQFRGAGFEVSEATKELL